MRADLAGRGQVDCRWNCGRACGGRYLHKRATKTTMRVLPCLEDFPSTADIGERRMPPRSCLLLLPRGGPGGRERVLLHLHGVDPGLHVACGSGGATTRELSKLWGKELAGKCRDRLERDRESARSVLGCPFSRGKEEGRERGCPPSLCQRATQLVEGFMRLTILHTAARGGGGGLCVWWCGGGGRGVRVCRAV